MVSTTPAVIAGVVLMLWSTGTTLNIESFMGAIMGVGVAVANAILLVTFAERPRVGGRPTRPFFFFPPPPPPPQKKMHRRRPWRRAPAPHSHDQPGDDRRHDAMALGLGEGGEQTAPLGRAVVGGLAAATLATLLVLPSFFAIIQARAHRAPPRWIPREHRPTQSPLAEATMIFARTKNKGHGPVAAGREGDYLIPEETFENSPTIYRSGQGVNQETSPETGTSHKWKCMGISNPPRAAGARG